MLFMQKVGPLIHVICSSIPPLVLSSIQWLALILLVFLCMQVQAQSLDAQPNIEWPLLEPSGGTYAAFRSYFHLWLVSQVFGGPLVSPQGYDDELEVTWGGSRLAGFAQAGRPKSCRPAR